MLTLLVQFGGSRFHPGSQNLWQPVGLLSGTAFIALVVVPLLELAGRRHRRRRSARRRRQRDAQAEQRARALMSELCPFGWRAQIHLGQGGSGVTLDWMELRPGAHAPAVVRQITAPTIAAALDAMVADRRTDETLERIEAGAAVDWPES